VVAVVDHLKQFLIKDKVLRVEGVDDADGQIFLHGLFEQFDIVGLLVLDVIKQDCVLPIFVGEYLAHQFLDGKLKETLVNLLPLLLNLLPILKHDEGELNLV
jgi:hypothetical protein